MMRSSPVPITRAASDTSVNESTVGLPAVLVPREHAKAGKPVEVEAGKKKTLTLKAPSWHDFFIEWITLVVYRLAGSAGSRTATRVDPDAAIGAGSAADLRLRWYDGSTGRELFRGVPWPLLAGNGMRPHALGVPHLCQHKRVINIEIDNRDASNAYAVSLHLHGRRRATEATIGAHRDKIESRWASLRQPEHCYLVPDNDDNARGAGLFRMYGTHDNTVASGNYDAPGAVLSTRIVSEEGRNFFACSILGNQRIANTAGWRDKNTYPVLVRVVNRDLNYWLTEDFVPMEALCGWGGEPGQLGSQWAWRAKGAIGVEFKSMHSADVICDLTFAGYLRDEGYA